ncbi:MAG: hypothetical protein M3442_06625, partial [Chloroflexota bacterium]|nr:hypothetical protein [Chloroflexota bacterium]
MNTDAVPAGVPSRRRFLAAIASGACAPVAMACSGSGTDRGGAGAAGAGGAAAVKFPETLVLTTIYNFQQNDPGFMAAA